MFDNPTATSADQPRRLATALLGLPAILSLFLILHHPTVNGVQAAGDVARTIRGMASQDGFVHGGLMVMYGAQGVGFYLFSARLGWRRPEVVAAFMVYTASVLILAIPTTLDGFVTPDVVAACRPAPGGCADTEKAALPIIGAMIQDFTKVAIVATAVATLLWSFSLLGVKRLASRAAGVAGLLCGALPVTILVMTAIRLQPGNLAVIIVAQLIWSLVAAALVFCNEV